MNVDLPEMLATQAGAVDPPRIDPGDVIARGERLLERRRRRAATWAAGGLALVAAAKWIDYVVTATLVLTPLALAGAVVLAVT